MSAASALLWTALLALPPEASALEINPWQVGPAPSAHPTRVGYSLGPDVGGAGLGPRPLWGARVAASVTPTPRLWTGVELAYGTGWRSCVGCESYATTWTVRGLAVRRRAVNLAPWSALTIVNGAVEWTPGLALEAGTRRVRFDTSWPLWSTWDLLTVLRGTPEVGVTGIWSRRQATRVALVGLEPAVAVTHRVQLEHLALTVTAQVGEEGLAVMIGARFFAGWP